MKFVLTAVASYSDTATVAGVGNGVIAASYINFHTPMILDFAKGDSTENHLELIVSFSAHWKVVPVRRNPDSRRLCPT